MVIQHHLLETFILLASEKFIVVQICHFIIHLKMTERGHMFIRWNNHLLNLSNQQEVVANGG